MTMTEEKQTESRPFEADVAKLLHLMVHSVYSEKVGFSARTDLECRRRLRAAALRSHRRTGAARRGAEAAHHAHGRCRQTAADRRGQRHRHEPRRDGRGARHHRPLRHQGVSRSHRGGEGRRGDGADRPVRRRLLLGLHGGGTGRGDFPPRRNGCGVRLVFGRQGHLRRIVRRSRHTRRFAAPVSCCTFWRTPNPIPSAPPSSGWCAPSPATCRCRSRSSWRPAPRSPKSPTARALWAKPKSAITAADYTDFYRSIAGQFDEPALTIHFHAEGRHDYTSLFFVPGCAAVRSVRSRPQGPDQALRQARLHHRRCRDIAALSALRSRPGR